MKTICLTFTLLASLASTAAPLVPPLPKENAEQMLSFYRDAAAHGSPKAMFTLAYYNENGIGMPVNREEALKWYRKVYEVPGQNPDGVQDEAVKAIDRLGGIDFPFDPQTVDGNTILDFITAQTNRANSVLVSHLLRNKTVGRTLTFTNMVAFFVQRLKTGDINLTLDPKQSGHGRPSHSTSSSIRVEFNGEAANNASYLDRDDVVARLDGIVVTNCPWYWGFVVKGVSVTPLDPSLSRPLPPFDAAKITGDELIDYLHDQRRTIRKWQFIEIQNRLAGRRLTFHKMRLSGSSGMFNRKDDKFWLGAVASWEAVGEGDKTGFAEFRLSFPDKDSQEFAAHLVMQSSFAFLDEVTGTFAKGVDPDDGWAFQLEDVTLLPSGMVKHLDGLGDGVVSGDELVHRIGTNFTPMEQLSISLLLKGREISFSSAVVESCRPCWTNDTLSLICRLSPLVRNDRGRQNPFRISFEVPAEKASTLRRTPIPGDLVIKIKGRPVSLGTPDPRRRNYSEHPVLQLDNPDFDITWRSDVAKTTGLDSRPGDRIVRRLCLCWKDVRDDQFIRLARKVSGQKVEFGSARVLASTRQSDGTQRVTVTLLDPLYGECVNLPLVVTDAACANKAEGLEQGTILRHIRGTLVVKLAKSVDWEPLAYWPRLKDATFEVVEKPAERK